MLRMLLLALVRDVLCIEQHTGVVETAVSGFGYTPGISNSNIGVQSVILKPDQLYLRHGLEESSLLRWESKNTTDNWSFIVHINDLNLNSNEFAGIYLRYTNEPAITGNYKGGESIFHGLMIGLEFRGKLVSIVSAESSGEDYEHEGEDVVKRDNLNPIRFRDLDEIIMKVICTEKNIKMELYDGGRLVYDKFRLYNVKKDELYKAGRYFGIVAYYPRVASSKAFVLKSAQLYERIESDAYDVYKMHALSIVPMARIKQEIKHHNSDVQELIYRMEHAFTYIRGVLGELPNTLIVASERDLEHDMNALEERIEKVHRLVKSRGKKAGFSARLNDFEVRTRQIQRSIGELEFAINKNMKAQRLIPSILSYAIVASGCLVLYVLGCREMAAIKALRNEKK